MREEVIQEMKAYFGTDEKRINHALNVLKNAEDIYEGENIDDEDMLEVIILSSVLHDIGIHEAERKHNSVAGKFQEIEGPPIADEIMKKLNVRDEIKDRVLYIIGNHHTLAKVDNTDFQILWEADLYVNLEEKDLYHDRQHHPYMDRTFKTKTGKEKLRKLFGIDN